MSCMPSLPDTRAALIALATSTVVSVFCSVYFLFRVGLYFATDAMLQTIHHEYHAYFQRSLASPPPGHAGNAEACVACVIAYREDETVFERCLRSYTKLGTSCKAFVLGVDGEGPDNLAMTTVFKKVGRRTCPSSWTDTKTHVFGNSPQVHALRFEQPLGMLAEHLYQKSRLGHAQNNDGTVNHEQYALKGVLLHIREALEPVLTSYFDHGGTSAEKKRLGYRRRRGVCCTSHLAPRTIRRDRASLDSVGDTELGGIAHSSSPFGLL